MVEITEECESQYIYVDRLWIRTLIEEPPKLWFLLNLVCYRVEEDLLEDGHE